MDFDAVATLRTEGHAVDMLTKAQREVLAELTQSEVEFLIRLKRRLDEVGPDVAGQELKLL